MQQETVEATIRWLNSFVQDNAVHITFHGGEPLLAGIGFYRMALPLLQQGFATRKLYFTVQSNLWLLTDELCELFRTYRVALGTSLDGPEAINDAQRGHGYFRRTMDGIERARQDGLSLGCICTFTAQSAPHAADIFDFFVREELSFSIHAALPSIRYKLHQDGLLSPEAHGELLVAMFDRYVENASKLRIESLDSLCQSVAAGCGSICTFGDCLGSYLCVGPDGDIFPCQRFAGMPQYRLGNVAACPTAEELAATPVWRAFQERQECIAAECTGCAYVELCRGGCPYNVLAANGESFSKTLRDPYCASYKRIFGHIVDRAMSEVFSTENLEDVVDHPKAEAGLLRRGKLISLMRGRGHPSVTAQHAFGVLSSVALAATGSPAESVQKFHQLGLAPDPQRTETKLRSFYQQLIAKVTRLNNLYLHVTYACPLRCTHCYAEAGAPRHGVMPVGSVIQACREAKSAGFRHVVITGGEPLVHPQRDLLLDMLFDLRQELKPLSLVLRTSLAVRADANLLKRIGRGTDEVVVSVDGDRDTHDRRRGAGSYDLTVKNLRTLTQMGYENQLSLAAVLHGDQVADSPGEAVRTLAAELGIRRTRFRPLLPLGRAATPEPRIAAQALWSHVDPSTILADGFNCSVSCGLGQNLYVGPDGSAYPCYALHQPHWRLGCINGQNSLLGLLTSPAFQRLCGYTVDSNQRCRRCMLRYLCGGACRAWDGQAAQNRVDPDLPPLDCAPLHQKAHTLLLSALEVLDLQPEDWLAVGLPLPDAPPDVL